MQERISMVSSLMRYTRRWQESILRLQKPERFSFKASGLPIPSNGVLEISLISKFIRLIVFYRFLARINNHPKLLGTKLISFFIGLN